MELKNDLFDLENEVDEKGRSRSWVLLLYPDNPDHVNCFEKISSSDVEFVGIKHDKDVLEDGSPAKPHWHILLRFKNPVWNTAVSDIFGIELRWIRKVDNWNRMARYLVHRDQPKKFQYDKECLFGSMVEIAVTSINKSDPEAEAQKVEQIVNLITDWSGKIEMAALVSQICKMKLYAEFRRGGQIFLRMVDSHNYAISRARQQAIAERLEAIGSNEAFGKSVSSHQDMNWVDRLKALEQTSHFNPLEDI